MKTPREIIFERHQSAEPKLDKVRRVALSSATGPVQQQARERRVKPRCFGDSLRELLLSFRWHLAGLTAAWIGIVVLNSDRSVSTVAAGASPQPPQHLVASLRENRRQLAEAMEIPLAEPTPENRDATPQRRSDRPRAEAVV
jgi:hypothetical protein